MNWWEVAADIAAVFHTQPSEIWAMSLDEFLGWHRQARRLTEREDS